MSLLNCGHVQRGIGCRGKITGDGRGARHVAVVNGGTIPDRGLFGVFLVGATRGARVGELDEEMVFESRTGDTIILGASTWRIEEITHDRVTGWPPAPGELAKCLSGMEMPRGGLRNSGSGSAR